MSTVALREITTDNWEECIQLKISEDQAGYVEPNVVSLAESRVHPWMLPLAIYAEDNMVGFVMYSDERDPRLPRYWIHRLMIDERYQGRGYGRAAMQAVIARLQQNPDCDEVWVGYVSHNQPAKRFYASLGFVEQGPAPWGDHELVARLTIDAG